MSLPKLASEPRLTACLSPTCSDHLCQLESQLILKDQQTMLLQHQLAQMQNKLLYEREESQKAIMERENRIGELDRQ